MTKIKCFKCKKFYFGKKLQGNLCPTCRTTPTDGTPTIWPTFTISQKTALTIIDLLSETRREHREEESDIYNFCETNECNWCERAATVLTALKTASLAA